MISFFRGVAWLFTAAILLRLLGYEVPFAHNLSRSGLRSAPTPLEQVTPQPEQEPVPQELPPEDPIASDFENYWPQIP